MNGDWSDPAAHKDDFARVNGVRLNYLDWGGSGPALIFLHGAGQNPHYFDDLAPAFVDRFRVVAYARRGHGRSDAKPPYDTATLTDDLRGLMDTLGISRTHLAGHSMGGNEITRLAVTHPERVDRIVYLDAAYDMADPEFAAALRSLPPHLQQGTPPSALTTVDAFRANVSAMLPAVADTRRFEAWMREDLEIQPDGSIRLRPSEGVRQAFVTALSEPRDYTRIRVPALAIFSASFGDLEHGDPTRIAENLEWNRKHIGPWREKSIARVRREIPNVKILSLPGTHDDLVFTCREQIVAAMRQFLLDPGVRF
jgi:pimeloyl-ACP methyl ester carboxylesterase